MTAVGMHCVTHSIIPRVCVWTFDNEKTFKVHITINPLFKQHNDLIMTMKQVNDANMVKL